MKNKIVYIDEISGNEFDSKAEAEISEKRSKDIKEMFAFAALSKKEEKDDCCKFGNGEYCVQRDEAYYNKLKLTLIIALKKYEKWVCREFKKHGGIEKCIHPFGLLARYLGDGDSPLCEYLSRLGNICPKCYREWGQGYYSLHCNHTDTKCEYGL